VWAFLKNSSARRAGNTTGRRETWSIPTGALHVLFVVRKSHRVTNSIIGGPGAKVKGKMGKTEKNPGARIKSMKAPETADGGDYWPNPQTNSGTGHLGG